MDADVIVIGGGLSGLACALRLLDYRALDLRAFYPGALVRIDDRFHR